jgi:hypothetical protein
MLTRKLPLLYLDSNKKPPIIVHAADENKPMYTAAMWQHMIQKYIEVTGDKI